MLNSENLIQPLVTVGMVTYNSSRFVKIAIESVLNQSYKNLELIISDDASTDETWEIISSYNDPRIRAYQNASNIREYPNRSRVLSLTKGEYFIFIDGDDVLYPHGLEFMVKMLHAFPESAMALSLPPRPYFIYPCELTPKQVYLFDFLGNSVTHHGFPYTLFRTSILKKCGITTEYKAGDTFIKKYIALTNNVLLIPEGSAWWRETPGQASSKLKINMRGDLESLKYNFYFLNHPDCPLSPEEISTSRKLILRNFLRTVARNYILIMKPFTAIKILKQSKIAIKDYKYIFYSLKSKYKAGGSETNPVTDIDRHPYSSFIY